MSDFVTPWTVAHQAPQSMNSPGKNTGVGCHFLLQEIVPTQASNVGLPHFRHMFLPTEPPGNQIDNVVMVSSAQQSNAAVHIRSPPNSPPIQAQA